jgi:Ni,Fe-hydrogenase III component G
MLHNQTKETNEVQITVDKLFAETKKLADNGYRFIISDVFEAEDNFELIYEFGKDYDATTLRLTVAKGSEIPSISPIFFNALLIENENQDLYGLKYKGLVVDFGGRLYMSQDDVEAPPQSMAGMNVSLVKKWNKKADSAKKEG